MRALLCIYIAVGLGLSIGWVMNIVGIFHTASGLTPMIALRIAGIFVPPLGGILGYL